MSKLSFGVAEVVKTSGGSAKKRLLDEFDYKPRPNFNIDEPLVRVCNLSISAFRTYLLEETMNLNAVLQNQFT